MGYPRGLSTSEPNRRVEEFSASILGNIYEGLVETDDNLALRPALAESWYSPDDLTWVFRLREGVRFHDGSLLDASRVVDCLEQLRHDPTRDLSPALSSVSQISAQDAHTVRVLTRFPVPSLPYHLGGLLIAARAASGETMLGTGPFRIREQNAAGEVTLSAFADYWGGRPALATLKFRVLPNADDRVRALREGALDLAVDVPATTFATLAGAPELRTIAARSLRVILLGLDIAPGQAASNPLHDPRIRRAIALAIDRPRLVRDALGGQAEVVNQVLAPEIFGYHTALPDLPHDPAEARRLLAEADLGNGFDVALDFPPERYRSISDVASSIQEDLASVGIRVILRPAPTDAFIARLAARDSRLFLLGWTSGGDAPLTYDYLLHTRSEGHGSANYTGYADPDFDRVVASAEIESSTPKRGDRVAELAAQVLRDLPVVPLYRQYDLYAVRAGVRFSPRPDRLIRGRDLGWQ